MATVGLSPLQYLIRYYSGKQKSWAWTERQEFYRLAEAYYANTAYESLADGGFRDYLLAEFGADVASKVEGIYNPVQRVVDLYKYVFAGKFGRDIKIETTNRKVAQPIEQIYKWSNFNAEKRGLTYKASLLGTVGIRIVALPASRKTYLKFEHPKKIKDILLDDRGNVQQVLLEYPRLEGRLGEEREEHIITELLTPEYFETKRDDEPFDLINNKKNGPLWRFENQLGVCPYVRLPHIYIGDEWGLPAWYGQAGPIDATNVLASHIDEQIRRHVKVKWFITAAGKPPENVDLGDTTVAYVQLDPSQTAPAPTMEAMVAPLSLADALQALDRKVDALKDAMPELKATDGKFLAGQSGETIAQLRLPAEELIRDARAHYEDALIRANKIALSWGVRLGLWDVGTGTGSQQAAQQAYEAGLEDHEFADREALPETVWEQLDLEGKQLDNKNKLYTGIETLSRAGAISLEEMVKEAHPEWTDKQVQDEVDRIEKASEVTPPDTGSEGSAVDPLASFLGQAQGQDQQAQEQPA